MTEFPFIAFALLGTGILGIFGAAFFAAAEVALISSDKAQLRRLREKKYRRADAALKLLDNVDQLLTTTQVGANLTQSLAATALTIFATRFLHTDEKTYWVALVTICLLLFSDSLPKVIGRHRSDRISILVALPLLGFQKYLGR